jgi:hypothetical protein
VLDPYSRATDSLMDVIASSQARPLTFLRLKGCNGLTGRGFRNIGRFEELEFQGLSLCRITDMTLQFTLNLPYLNTLQLPQIKVTTGGLARIIAEAAWKSTLHTLDVSECQGIKGPAVFVNLQGRSLTLSGLADLVHGSYSHSMQQLHRPVILGLILVCTGTMCRTF